MKTKENICTYFQALIVFLIILPTHNLILWKPGRPNYKTCENATECKCRADQSVNLSWALDVRCKTFPSSVLENLPSARITTLSLYEGSRYDTTLVLESLRNKTANLRKLHINNCGLKHFEWKWLPGEFFHNLSLAYNGIERVVVAEDYSTDCDQEKKRLSNMKGFFATGEVLAHIPSCLPDSLRVILITHSKFSAENITEISWPRSLKHLKISINTPGIIPQAMFQNMTDNLSLIWIAHYPIIDGIFPALPTSKNLKTIYIQNCNISKIKPDQFARYTNLTSLNLAFNAITEAPGNLPHSLKRLDLYGNKIEYVEESYWSNLLLESMDMSRNNLESVPSGLPATMRKLDLSNNKISYSDPGAFSHMKELEDLDLSHNNLYSMPTGIPSGILFYSIEHNFITHVLEPAMYEFCWRCADFNYGGNPWLCDKNFITMMIWVTKNMAIWRTDSFSQGRCVELPKKAFDTEWLTKTIHYMDYISKPPFENCTYNVQEILNCTNQDLKYFPASPTEGVKKVIIEGNKDLTEIPDNLFEPLTTLKSLLLERNNLKRIPYGLPTSLLELSLRKNNISELSERDVEVFHTLVNLRNLYLEDNQLKTIYSTQLTPLIRLDWIGLETNPLICDCSLQSLIYWFTDLAPILSKPIVAARYARCGYPENMYGRDIRKISRYYEYELSCVPKRCSWMRTGTTLNCSLHGFVSGESDFFFYYPLILGKMPEIPANSFWKKVLLDGWQIPDDEIELRHLERLTYVDLSNNSLTEVPLKRMPPTVEILILNKNKITHLPTSAELDEFLPNLHRIDLRNNAIKTLDEKQVTLLPLIEFVQLKGNPFECNCFLRQFISWVQTNKNTNNLTTVNQFEELTCETPSGLHGKTLMKITDIEFCKNFYLEIVGAVVGVLALIIVLVIIVSIYLQKKRKQRKREEIIKGFQEVLQQEATFASTDAETGIPQKTFEYDAFVSSATDDEDGVFLDLLMQELEEKHGYHLCISQRDFVPGMGLADNIVKCIGASKRIILILSRNFISSPWCQYEVQVALAELHQRRSKLLVPIMIEDLTSDVNVAGCIKSFLTLVPMIRAASKHSSQHEWAKFWSLLRKSIPKEMRFDEE